MHIHAVPKYDAQPPSISKFTIGRLVMYQTLLKQRNVTAMHFEEPHCNAHLPSGRSSKRTPRSTKAWSLIAMHTYHLKSSKRTPRSTKAWSLIAMHTHHLKSSKRTPRSTKAWSLIAMHTHHLDGLPSAPPDPLRLGLLLQYTPTIWTVFQAHPQIH